MGLRKADIVEIKSLRSPPPLVRFVMEAINIMFGYPADWYYSKKLLGKENFGQMLCDFDRDNMSDEILEKLEPYVRDLNVNRNKIKFADRAISGLWDYVVALYRYGIYVKQIKAKRMVLKKKYAS